jgi:tripartite-type tricarboxylate transporter receptor subunit TctC
VAPGGTPDLAARTLAPELGKRLGQPVVVENRPGAQTNLAMETVARAAPDGYTLLFALTSLVINPELLGPGVDPLRDFAPVALLQRTQFLLAVSPALPVATPTELIAYARARPGAVNCAHSGGVTQLGCALLASLAQLELTLVPYKGNALILRDAQRGEVHLFFENLGNAEASVRGGQLRALAVTDPALGSDPLPPLPALGATVAGFELTSWQGIVAPAGTPAAAVARLNEEIGAVLRMPLVARRVGANDRGQAHLSPEAFSGFLREERERYARIVRKTGLRAQPTAH